MGSGGGKWDTGDNLDAARLNQKTLVVDTGTTLNALTKYDGMEAKATDTSSIFVQDNYYFVIGSTWKASSPFRGTGTQIAALVTNSLHYSGLIVFCTSSGSGFTINHIYRRNAANSAWDDLTAIDPDIEVFPYDTTIGDYSQPTLDITADILASSNNPTFIDGFASYADTTAGDAAWPTSDTAAMRVNPTNDNIDFNMLCDNTNDCITKDLGAAVSDTLFCVRFTLKWSAWNTSQVNFNSLFIGLSDNTSAQNVAQDFIGLFIKNSSTQSQYTSVDVDGAAITTTPDNTVNFTPSLGTVYYFEIVRTSATAYTVRRYTDASYSSVADSAAGTCVSTTQTLRYIKICNRVASTTVGAQTGVLDDVKVYSGTSAPTHADMAIDGQTATRWESASEVNPWIRVTMSSAADKEPAAIAIFPHANTTATQIKIQTSPDGSTWTDKRLINVSDLSMGAWNYIRFNRDTAQVRYIRIYGNDGSAKALAIYEAKCLIPTESQWNRRHGHKAIPATDASLAIAE